MSNAIRFGIDCDGILYDWSGTARFLLEHRLGLEKRIPDSNQWNFLKDYCGDEAWGWLWGPGVTEYGLFRHGHVYRGSVEAMKELATLGEVSIITHRPREAVNDTFDWLSHHRIPASNLYILHNLEPKWEIQPQFHFFLDDKPENVADYHENSDAVVAIWDRSWNEGNKLIPNDVLHVNTWREVLDIVKERVCPQESLV